MRALVFQEPCASTKDYFFAGRCSPSASGADSSVGSVRLWIGKRTRGPRCWRCLRVFGEIGLEASDHTWRASPKSSLLANSRQYFA
ncbi:hypothetical protein BC938DRAFT_477637 [Jimgerdemannia flammicorona]|uniref:Uncharacterized protein n=1 Tax=Jimgerdemannia flammicorona TaxID=994334 RepID=A0A433P8H3_9FUNG|nr:hypothetical protein BC938DRAFT_477637 [Jimgerdemannia flammicorona]